MSRSTFRRDPAFKGALLRSAGVRDALQDRVGAAAELASQLAPDDPATTGKDLHSSVVGDVGMTADGWLGRVVALNFKAPWFEFGARGVPKRPFLRPAVEREVGKVEKGGRRG